MNAEHSRFVLSFVVKVLIRVIFSLLLSKDFHSTFQSIRRNRMMERVSQASNSQISGAECNDRRVCHCHRKERKHLPSSIWRVGSRPYLTSHRRFIVLQDAGPEMKQVTKCDFSLFIFTSIICTPLLAAYDTPAVRLARHYVLITCSATPIIFIQLDCSCCSASSSCCSQVELTFLAILLIIYDVLPPTPSSFRLCQLRQSTGYQMP